MDKLKTYIENRNLTVKRAAAEIGITRQHLHCALRGQVMGRRTAKKIEAWTNGAVTAIELMKL